MISSIADAQAIIFGFVVAKRSPWFERARTSAARGCRRRRRRRRPPRPSCGSCRPSVHPRAAAAHRPAPRRRRGCSGSLPRHQLVAALAEAPRAGPAEPLGDGPAVVLGARAVLVLGVFGQQLEPARRPTARGRRRPRRGRAAVVVVHGGGRVLGPGAPRPHRDRRTSGQRGGRHEPSTTPTARPRAADVIPPSSGMVCSVRPPTT